MTETIHHTTIAVPLYLYDPEGDTVSQVDPTTAPHDCDMPGCPGPVNQRKLEAFPELLAACIYAIGCIDGEIRDYRDELPKKLRAAIAKAGPQAQ